MIKVTDKYYIDANTNCYTLKEKNIVQDKTSSNYGKEVFKELGYHTSIQDCLNGILKANTREFVNSKESTIYELIILIKEQQEFLKSLKLDKLEED